MRCAVNVEILRESGEARVVVQGEVDADNKTKMGSEILDGTEGASKVLVDLSGLTFIDSSGLGELLRINEVADSRSQQFEIVEASAAVRRILDITGLLDHFGLSEMS